MAGMTNDGKRAGGLAYLGIEAGGTRTVALLEQRDRSIQREFGPANLRLMTDKDLLKHFSEIARDLPRPNALAIGMAGARTETDRRRIQNAAAKTWPQVPC